MMEKMAIDGAENVVGLSYCGTISAEDIDRSYELMIPAMKDGKPVSLYIEMLDGFDIEAPALFKDLRRSPEIMSKFKQIERVAVVTNQDWLRGIVRLEDAVLSLFNSDIALQVYSEDERNQAKSWVAGETTYSHEPSIVELTTDDPYTAAFEINGKVRKEDIELSKKMMTEFMTDDPPRRLLARIRKLDGLQPSTLFDGQMIQMKREARKHLDRYAIVGGPEWLQHLARAMAPLFDFQIRTFELDEEESAWEWLEEKVAA